jgi:hypothetical protein
MENAELDRKASEEVEQEKLHYVIDISVIDDKTEKEPEKGYAADGEK